MVLKFCRRTADSLNEWQCRRGVRPENLKLCEVWNRHQGAIMSSISAVALSQDALASSKSPSQQALQALQNSLATGDLTGAQSAFQSLRNALQDSATASGSTLSSNSPLASDLASLSSALSSGNLSAAQSAFATFLGDLQNTASPAQSNVPNAASQSVGLVEELLSTVNSTSASSTTAPSSTSADATIALLQSYYGSKSGLNVLG